MLISHKGHTDTIQVYSVTVMTHVKALQAGHSSQGTSEPITPAISTAPASSSAPAGLSAQRPPSLREYPDPSSRTPESTQLGSHWLSPGYSGTYDHTSTQKGRVSPKLEGGCHSSSDLPETSASPTWVSAAVTGMFHTPQTVTMRTRRTLPDSAGLPPGLSSTNMCPYNKTHSSLRKG